MTTTKVMAKTTLVRLQLNLMTPGSEKTLDRLATAKGAQWYECVLRRDSDHELRRALKFEVVGKRGRGRPKKAWRRQEEKHIEQTRLKKEDVTDRMQWRKAVYEPS